jgi:hypothetical protein
MKATPEIIAARILITALIAASTWPRASADAQQPEKKTIRIATARAVNLSRCGASPRQWPPAECQCERFYS